MAEQRRYRDWQSERNRQDDQDERWYDEDRQARSRKSDWQRDEEERGRYGQGGQESGRGREMGYGGEGYGRGGYGGSGHGSEREEWGRGSYDYAGAGYQGRGYEPGGYEGTSGPSYGPGYRGYQTEPRYGYGYGSYGRQRGYGDEGRGMWDRASDEVSSWFGDREAERRREMDQHRGRGPKNYKRSDDRIREDVCDRLSDDGMVDASDIEVKVSGAEVTLTGTVDSRLQRRRAEDCVESVSGVSHVQNNLRVKSGTAMTGSKDEGKGSKS